MTHGVAFNIQDESRNGDSSRPFKTRTRETIPAYVHGTQYGAQVPGVCRWAFLGGTSGRRAEALHVKAKMRTRMIGWCRDFDGTASVRAVATSQQKEMAATGHHAAVGTAWLGLASNPLIKEASPLPHTFDVGVTPVPGAIQAKRRHRN